MAEASSDPEFVKSIMRDVAEGELTLSQADEILKDEFGKEEKEKIIEKGSDKF